MAVKIALGNDMDFHRFPAVPEARRKNGSEQSGYEVGKNMAELYPRPGGHIVDESCIVCRQIRVVLNR